VHIERADATRDIGLQGDLALYQMQESILAGRLPVKVTHTLDGAVQGESKSTVKPSFWRRYFVLDVIEGRARVVPIGALVAGEFVYTVAERDVRRLWPPTALLPAAENTIVEPFRSGGPGRPSAMEVILVEFERRIANRK
jgi:hypothetical protein